MSGKEKTLKDNEHQLQRTITKCWRDEKFKQKLMTHPLETLKAERVKVPDRVAIIIIMDTENVRTLVIPPAPKSLDDGCLNNFAAGFAQSGCGIGPAKMSGAGWY